MGSLRNCTNFSARTIDNSVAIGANLGRLRFVQLGSILAPIKRGKIGTRIFVSIPLAKRTASEDEPTAESLETAV